jgi:hypothetical protein
VVDAFFNDASWQEVELDAGGSVAGVGSSVDLEHDRNGRSGGAELVLDLGNEPAFALVAERDADVGDELAGKREK